MSQQQDPPSAKKRIRRCTKHDETPRPYKCGCGRGYYSYPALYTHLKIKHEGQPPTGTQIPSDKHYGSRGRPREKNFNFEEESKHQVFIDEDKREDNQKDEKVTINQ
ncbi:unnamed protein product [Paramecium primaurelia]|uniref:C2H2-type domain-containing protein n=2 Tax=Paramecium TaxID=5884 RepID=A0A8S1SP06_9CILI|nr:unnamed protein product [Paramecium primaurelia]CAD8140194.1 unnamed protein product [Paramecium pentaurelia]